MKNNPLRLPAFRLGLLLVLCLGEAVAHAATITWTNLSGGSFGTAANWSPNAVPGGGDVAVITNAGTYTVTLDGGRTVGGLLLGLPVGPNVQTLSLNGSVLTLSGIVTVNTSGTLILAPGASNLDWPSVVFTNLGTVIWSAGNIRGSTATQIYNYGLWQADSDNEYNNAFGGCCPGVFNNLGTFRKAAGTGTTAIGSAAGGVLFNNTGLLDVQTGTVSLATGGNNTFPGVFNTSNTAAVVFGASYTFNNGSQFTGTGDVRLEAGTFTMAGNITFTKLTQVGGALAGSCIMSGVYNWAGGVWNTGTRTMASGSTLNITNTINHDWPYVVFTNLGTVIWSGGNLQGSAGTVIYNYGTWQAGSDNEYNNAFGGCCPGVFNNLGVFRKAAGTGTTAIGSPSGGVIFNNSGLLDVQTGTVNLATAYNLTGGSINIGISSLSNFGKVGLAGAAALTGNFSANLIGGYIPITNNSFPVITYGSSSGLFTNYSLPFADAWTTIYSPTTFSLYVLNARPIPPLFTTNQLVNELTTLLVTNTAVDLDVPTNTLTYMLLAPPAGAAISSDGLFTWTPSEAQGPVTNVITSVVTDNGVPALSATNSFTVVVQEINVPPVLSPLANTNVNELTTLTLTNSATDSDLPVNTLTYELIAFPPGAAIDTNGVITWTPTETQGPGTNIFITVVTDYNPDAINEQQLTVTNTFEVMVNEVNVPPVLFVPANTNITELTNYSALATATDADLPANALSFELVSGPAGLTVSPGGLVNWTPTEGQGPSTNPVTLRVTDLNPSAINATSLSDTNSFTIIVTEVNVPPLLPAQTNVAIQELTTLTITNAATDSDIPTNALTYVLLDAPAGAAIDTNGVITWTPTEAQGPGTNTLTTVVTDLNPDASNLHQFSVTNTFEVVVQEVNAAPALTLPPNTNINELVAFTAQATATDSDEPANTLIFVLVSGPAGLTVSPSGAMNWTPTEDQGPGTNVVSISVTDTNLIAVNETSLSVTSSFEIVVNEMNVPPLLTVPSDQNLIEETPLNVLASATDADFPANTLRFALISPPAGMTINEGSGAISWTPTEDQGSNFYTITVTVTDTNPPAINTTQWSVTNSFTVTVDESNRPPVLTLPPTQTIAELTALSTNATATDPDSPANPLTFALLSGPPGLTVSPGGAVNWTPTENQGPGTNTVTISVTDTNPLAVNATSLSITSSFEVVVIEVNTAPVLTLPADTNVNELVAFTAQATATDADDPTNTLTFALVSGPAGLTVSPSGTINWTPTEEQGPGTNAVLIRVTDTNALALTANAITVTNTFAIVVNEVNSTPSLPLESVPPNSVINELVPYSFQLAAIDADVPTNQFTYQLISGPSGLTIATNGLVNWTPAEAQGPGSYNISFRVFDYSPQAVNAVSLTNSIGFALHVAEVNLPPVLAPLADHTVNPGQTISFLAEATDPDLPNNTLTFSLLSAPAGATIDATSGAFSWRPGVALTDTTNTIQVRVQDNGVPVSNDLKSFSVIINPLAAPVVLTPLSYNSGVFTLSATGTLGPDYVLMVSTNLQQWMDLKTNLTPALPTPFTDPDAGSLPTRVYRVRLQP